MSAAAEPSRVRFNSLDSGILLNTPVYMDPRFADSQTAVMPQQSLPEEPSPPLTYSRSGTPTAGGLLAPPAIGLNTNSSNQGSIAIRAMKSVRSLARIGSWAQLRNVDEGAVNGGSVRLKAPKEKAPKVKEVKESKKKEKKEAKADGEEGKKKKTKKKDKDKEKDVDKDKAQTLRLSTSSFEVGAASPMPQEKTKSLGKKKHSILGLGLPSTMTMRLPNVRNGSTASSVMMPPLANRLSVESAHILGPGRDRAGSVISTSTASSLRPMSTTSSMSGSRISSGSSVRWDEDCLENVKELRKRERREKEEKAKDSGGTKKKDKLKAKESRRSSEGRRRTPLAEVFPTGQAESPASVRPGPPIVTVEEATSDGHAASDDYSILEEETQEQPLATPVKKARPRPRPLSEQLLGRSRPRGMYEAEEGKYIHPCISTHPLNLLSQVSFLFLTLLLTTWHN